MTSCASRAPSGRGSSPLLKEHRKGTFACAGCDLPLFSSETKFESGTGWPSFWQPLENAVGETKDRTFGMLRTEIHCRRCGGHLGHVFDDGPKPTGLRYCMDGFALVFHPAAPPGELDVPHFLRRPRERGDPYAVRRSCSGMTLHRPCAITNAGGYGSPPEPVIGRQ